MGTDSTIGIIAVCNWWKSLHFVSSYPSFSAARIESIAKQWFPLFYSTQTKLTLLTHDPVGFEQIKMPGQM